MMEPSDEFTTGVRLSDGRWPSPPATWSFSSLHEVGQCPRRWMLSRATYTDLWAGWGYPPRPPLPALVGDIVHAVLELLVHQIRDAGRTSLADPGVVAVLKELGGYTRLVEDGIERRLVDLADNPRMMARIDPLRTALRARVPDMRQRIQALVARTSILLSPPTEDVAGGGTSNWLAPGAHPEVQIRAPELRLGGRVDLLVVDDEGCEITDYKTGAADDHHADQLRLYSLIWSRDAEHNPHSLPTRRLTLSYPTHDVEIAPLDDRALDALALTTADAIEAAEAALAERPPPAFPQPDICGFCGVRQLCDDYWMARPNPTDGQNHGSEWFDFEGTVVEQNGSRSWLLATTGEPVLLLRTPSEAVPFGIGDHLRLLSLRREEDDEASLPVAVLTSASEVFSLTEVG
jgi:RecB family exonuclease